MKKPTMPRKLLSMLLTLVMLFGMIPLSALTVYAGHTCDGCGDWIDGEPYCSECYQCMDCNYLCLECGVCLKVCPTGAIIKNDWE